MVPELEAFMDRLAQSPASRWVPHRGIARGVRWAGASRCTESSTADIAHAMMGINAVKASR